MVCRVPFFNQVQVRYQSEDAEKGGGILAVYWREQQSDGQEISGAEVFFNDLKVLKIWAAFLAVNSSLESAAWVSRFLPIQSGLGDIELLLLPVLLDYVLCYRSCL